MFKSVGVLINNRPLRTKGMLLALQVRLAAVKSIKKIFDDLPSSLLTGIDVSTYKNGALLIKTSSPLCAELQMRSERLKKEINERLGKRIIQKIRFRAGQIE